MLGGIKAWDGIIAEGPPEAGMAWFSPGTTAQEMVALAWLLEEGTRLFYKNTASLFSENATRELFEELVQAEQHHKNTLIYLYRALTGQEPDVDFPYGIIEGSSESPIMEGGIPVSEALSWSRGKPSVEILEFMIAQEANSLDLYIKMGRAAKQSKAKEMFGTLSREEKEHLDRLTEQFNTML